MTRETKIEAWGAIQDLHRASHRFVEVTETRDSWLDRLENYLGGDFKVVNDLKLRLVECDKLVEEAREVMRTAFVDFREHFGPDLEN